MSANFGHWGRQLLLRLRSWKFWLVVLGLVGVCLYSLTLGSKLPALLKKAQYLRERRFEPAVLGTIISIEVLAPTLSVVPSGAWAVATALVGYLYGLGGLPIATVGSSLGLGFIFGLGRLGRRLLGDLQAGVSPRKCACLRGPTVQSFYTVAQRWSQERPRRTAILLSFATHTPATMLFLGWQTWVRPADALLACACNGFKAVPALLKGMALADAIDLAGEDSRERLPCWQDPHCTGLIEKATIALVFGVAFFVSARSVIRDMWRVQEEEKNRDDSEEFDSMEDNSQRAVGHASDSSSEAGQGSSAPVDV